jgi:hypothetical protein
MIKLTRRRWQWAIIRQSRRGLQRAEPALRSLFMARLRGLHMPHIGKKPAVGRFLHTAPLAKLY